MEYRESVRACLRARVCECVCVCVCVWARVMVYKGAPLTCAQLAAVGGGGEGAVRTLAGDPVPSPGELKCSAFEESLSADRLPGGVPAPEPGRRHSSSAFEL